MTGTSEARHFRPDIEGLRAIAVCLVIAYHASPRRIHGGFVGVDVFFVISGFLITGLLLREFETSGSLSLTNFYARRARRLLPASALVLLATVVGCAIFLTPGQQQNLGQTARYTALYASNFWFVRQASDYFAPALANNPFLHTWSLAVEEQFYLVWPLLVLVCLRIGRSRTLLFTAMATIMVLSLALCVWTTAASQPTAFFSPFTRAWEFATGGLMLMVLTRREAVATRSWTRLFTGWGGLAAIVGAGLIFQGEAGFPGWRAIVPVAATAAVLYGGVPQSGGVSTLLALPIMQRLGGLSYAWYLWHWPLLALNNAMSFGDGLRQRLIETALCVVASLVLAAATHVVLENPIRFSRFLAARRQLSLGFAVSVTVVCVAAALAHERSTTERVSAIALAGGVQEDDASERLCPSVGFQGSDVVECIAGTVDASKSLVLFGDSHARQWAPAFDVVASELGWRLVVISKPACPSARVPIFSIALKRPYTECDAWREAALARIISMAPALVVVTNRQQQNFTAGLKGTHETWREASHHTLSALDRAGIATMLLRDTPSPNINLSQCLRGNVSLWSQWRSPQGEGRERCVLDRAAVFDEDVFRAERAAAKDLQHIAIVDLSDSICEKAGCAAVRDGVVVFRDDNHISGRFAKSLAAPVALAVRKLVSVPR